MANRDEVMKATDVQAAVPGSAAEALKKHEAAKMSRRAVLAKVGVQFGTAALLALSVDDIARRATMAIASRAQDSQVAQAVADEFKNAGIAFAETNSSGQWCWTSDICASCQGLNQGNVGTGYQSCADCANALMASDSNTSIVTIVRNMLTGNPMYTLPDSVIVGCGQQVEDQCNSFASGAMAMRGYLECILNNVSGMNPDLKETIIDTIIALI